HGRGKGSAAWRNGFRAAPARGIAHDARRARPGSALSARASAARRSLARPPRYPASGRAALPQLARAGISAPHRLPTARAAMAGRHDELRRSLEGRSVLGLARDDDARGLAPAAPLLSGDYSSGASSMSRIDKASRGTASPARRRWNASSGSPLPRITLRPAARQRSGLT